MSKEWSRVIISALILCMYIFGCGDGELPSPHNGVIVEKYTETGLLPVGTVSVPYTNYYLRYEYQSNGVTATRSIEVDSYKQFTEGDEIVLCRNEGCSGGWIVVSQ